MLHWCSLSMALLACAIIDVQPDQDPTWLRVEVAMAEDGFMCPFLTPMFIGILEDKGADWVICRPQASEIEFCIPLGLAQSQEGYVDWLTDLGYEEQHVTFLQFDTLATQPEIPAP